MKTATAPAWPLDRPCGFTRRIRRGRMQVMKRMRRYRQHAPVLRWLMAATLLLTMGLHAVACACTAGHDCSSLVSVPGASPCACAKPVDSGVDAVSSCCASKKAPAPKAASSCCSKQPASLPQAGGCCASKYHEDQATVADVAASSDHMAHWIAPAHACPCSISSAPEQNLPDRSTATLAQATPLDPRPEHAVISVDLSLDGLAPVRSHDMSHAPPAHLAATSAAFLCTFRC